MKTMRLTIAILILALAEAVVFPSNTTALLEPVDSEAKEEDRSTTRDLRRADDCHNIGA